ncbi:MAG: SpoIIE family protein phosphatase [Chloroflexi bacterium]|nr:SpoIIE family protein phosphatase [Chloroflexota bacterium]
MNADLYKNIQNMARSLELSGASAIILKENGKEIARFPQEAQANGPHFTVHSTRTPLELSVYNLQGEAWIFLAQTYLDLLSSSVRVDEEMEDLTAALVETQDRLVALFELTQAVRKKVEISEVLDLLTAESRRLLDSHAAYGILLQQGQPPIIKQKGGEEIPDSDLLAIVEMFRANPTKHLIKSVEQKFIPRNMMWVSLSVRDTVFAALGLSQRDGMEFTSPDIKLAQAISDQISVQMENALYYQETVAKTRLETEMLVARDVQMALLPQMIPTVPGLDVYGISVPSSQVGGDFFDVLGLENQSFLMYIGDISGKGIPAALMMTMARTVAHSLARRIPTMKSAELVNRMNSELTPDFSNVNMFTTFFVGHYDPSERNFSFTNAGQSPILLTPARKPTLLLAAEDLPIGILDSHSFTQISLELEVGDILVAATDGFNETWNNAQEMYGYERLKDLLDQIRETSAEEIAVGFFKAVEVFSENHPQTDDRTILVIKAVPMDCNESMNIPASLMELDKVMESLKGLVKKAIGDMFGPKDVYACELALQELLSNIIKHALLLDDTQRVQVKMTIDVSNNQIVLETEDTGVEFVGDLKNVEWPDPDLLPEGKYGLSLIRSLVDEVSYCRQENSNYWKLAKIIQK